MKLNAELAGQPHELKIQRDGSSVSADVDGRHYELEVRSLNAADCLLIEDTRIYDCQVSKLTEGYQVFDVSLGARSYQIRLVDPKRLRGAQSSAAHDHGSAEIIATMPGKVVRVLVEVGTRVQAGAGMVVVEAMKMQNELKAPRAGTVIALHAAAGATVDAGDVLAIVE